MLLKNEISFGTKCLSLAADLRDECLRLREEARDRRRSDEEEKRKEKEKEERRKLREMSAPDLPPQRGGSSGPVGEGKRRKTRRKTEPAEKSEVAETGTRSKVNFSCSVQWSIRSG